LFGGENCASGWNKRGRRDGSLAGAWAPINETFAVLHRRSAGRRVAMLKLVLLAAAIALMALLVAGCVERMFFYPDSAQYTQPQRFGLSHEDVFITTADGAQLHGWWLPAKAPALGTVLHLHGNAANIGNHLPLVAWLPAAGFNVLMLDYRGFGRSQGRPTLAGVVDDAAAALRYLRARPDIDAQRLIVFGQSLGGATALRLLARDAEGVRLAVIEAAFASYRGIARDAALRSIVLAPLLPLALPMLPGAADDPVTALAKVRVPLLILHGTADEVIPFAHGERLAAAAPEAVFIRIEGASHMELLTHPGVRQRVLDAMRAAVQ
jgi:fermentation-respiration switch protein FrsA (DUF1100 family)